MVNCVIGIYPVAGRREPFTGTDCFGSTADMIAALGHVPTPSVSWIKPLWLLRQIMQLLFILICILKALKLKIFYILIFYEVFCLCFMLTHLL